MHIVVRIVPGYFCIKKEKLMMTREEVLSIEEYCAEHKISHKKHLGYRSGTSIRQSRNIGRKMSRMRSRDSLFSFHPVDMSRRQCLLLVQQASPASQSNRQRIKAKAI